MGVRNNLPKRLSAKEMGARCEKLISFDTSPLRYWDKINPEADPNDVGLVRWLSRQCLGIMETVSVIHHPSHLSSEQKFGRHGDIKAEKFLWFKARPNDPMTAGFW